MKFSEIKHISHSQSFKREILSVSIIDNIKTADNQRNIDYLNNHKTIWKVDSTMF